MDEDLTRGMHSCRYFLAQRFDRLTLLKANCQSTIGTRPADILPLLCRRAKKKKKDACFQKGQQDPEEFDHHYLTAL